MNEPDVAVVLARGRSTRMGVPKGLVTLTDTGRTFLSLVAGLYHGLGWPVLVVTLPRLAQPYSEQLPEGPGVSLLSEPAGGDTARTLWAAWRHMAAGCGQVERVWAHPVDLPLVQRDTIGLLQATARRHPGQVVRPVHGDRPGHPVVLPWARLAACFARREQAPPRGPMRDLLPPDEDPALIMVPVRDGGVIHDFDTPADLATTKEKNES